MVYVDENLCTGCGMCVDACNRSAISLDGPIAFIAQESCTSCGRCVDVCPMGAIIQVEPVEIEPITLVHPPVTSAAQNAIGAAPMPASSAFPVVPASRPSRLASVERVLSGIFGLVTFAFDLKQAASTRNCLTPSGGRRSGGRRTAAGPACGPKAGSGRGRRHDRRRSGRTRGCN